MYRQITHNKRLSKENERIFIMNQYIKGVLCTITGGICWGISGTCGEYLCTFRGMDTRLLTDIRLLGAGLVLCLLILCRQNSRRQLKELLHMPNSLLHCVVFGICGLMFTQFTYLTAITKTNAGTATVLQYLSTIFVLIFVCIRSKKAPIPREIIAILSCLLGTFLVATHGSFTNLYISAEGLLWGILSAVAAMLYILIPQNLLKEWGSILPIGIGMLSGGIAFFFLMRVWAIEVNFDVATVLITLIIVLIGTVLAFTLFLKGTSLVGPARGNMIGCVEPLVATICSAVFLDVVFKPLDIIGFAFILATVFILAKK